MEWNTEFREGYLLVTGRGDFDVPAMREGLRSLGELVVRERVGRLLIDALGIAAPAAEFDRFQAGKAVAEHLPATVQIAVVYPKALTNRFGENAAVNRGARLRVFGDRAEALLWLGLGVGSSADPAGTEAGSPGDRQ